MEQPGEIRGDCSRQVAETMMRFLYSIDVRNQVVIAE